MRQTQNQKRFYNLEVAADWREHYAAIPCPRRRTIIGPAVCNK